MQTLGRNSELLRNAALDH